MALRPVDDDERALEWMHLRPASHCYFFLGIDGKFCANNQKAMCAERTSTGERVMRGTKPDPEKEKKKKELRKRLGDYNVSKKRREEILRLARMNERES